MNTSTDRGLALTPQQAASVAAALRAAARIGAKFAMEIPAAEGTPCVVFAGTGAVDIKRFAPFHRESNESRRAFCAAYGLPDDDQGQLVSGLNLGSARVVGDSSYTPKRFYIEDGGGRLLRRAKSSHATRAPARYWHSDAAAQAALDKLRNDFL